MAKVQFFNPCAKPVFIRVLFFSGLKVGSTENLFQTLDIWLAGSYNDGTHPPLRQDRSGGSTMLQDARDSDVSQWLDLSGQVAVVTGGGRGIGRAIARLLGAAGAGVAVTTHTSSEGGRAVVAELEAAGRAAMAVQADVRRADQVDAMMATVVERLGGVDILVNNAGIFTTAPQTELSEANWDAVFDTNLKGLWLCTRAAARQMMAQGRGGCVVNLASINGVHPGFGGTAHYDASKGGVIAYTRSLAAELAPHGIRVNAVGPGLTDSPDLRRNAPDLARTVADRTPLKRLGQPEEMARVVLFLASPLAGWVTGQTLFVDGGYLLT
jgi:NAD(P)-dependent dehydrogenase (short-subunit alcohol dehydrogenase family)